MPSGVRKGRILRRESAPEVVGGPYSITEGTVFSLLKREGWGEGIFFPTSKDFLITLVRGEKILHEHGKVEKNQGRYFGGGGKGAVFHSSNQERTKYRYS